MGTAPPFLYSAERRDMRFPDVPFDPKAVTRASWEPKPRKPQPRGPLVSFNRHPDSYSAVQHLSSRHLPLGPRAKKWIKRLRRLQLGLRVLQLKGALGTLTLMVLIVNMESVTAWTLRATLAVSILHTLYAVYHLSRSAASRPPASSAAYHAFALAIDLAIVGLYAFGAFSVHREAGSWATRLADQHLMRGFVPAAYYTFIGTGALHLASGAISLWLGLMFRKITLMPPDMNPLEDHLTARPSHRRNKSSIATASTGGDESRCSASVAARNRPGSSIDDTSRPPSIPFMHTRAGSSYTASSESLRPKAPYENLHRGVAGFAARATPRSAGPASSQPSPWSASYTGLPLEDLGQGVSPSARQTRIAKFTETWLPTDSLISRTNHRIRNATAEIDIGQERASHLYSAVPEEYNIDYSSESEGNCEWESTTDPPLGTLHPNPLRSHPALCPRGMYATGKANSTESQSATGLPGHGPLSDMSGNQRQASLSRDIVDQLHGRSGSWKLRRRSSIQAEDDFCLRPASELMCAAPPTTIEGTRKVSSGNDYMYASEYQSKIYGRRNVSGRQAEEGRADARVLLRSCAI